MKLGITVVYFVKEGEGWLVDLHLKFIRNCTSVPYKIYAAVERLLPECRNKLEADDIIICRFNQTEEIAGKENSYYLEQLFHCAIADGCTHIAAFHVDSFPVRKDWVEYLLKKLDAGFKLAAIERAEEQDHKPHSSFLFFPSTYYLEYKPALRLADEERKGIPYRNYLKACPHVQDSGSGFGFQLFEKNLDWYGLHRSNMKQDHRLLAGIYDDLIFHLGGAGFTMVYSNHDRIRYKRKITVIKKIFKIFKILFPGLQSFEDKYFPAFDKSTVKRKISNKNRKVMKQIKIRLNDDPELFLNYLRNVH